MSEQRAIDEFAMILIGSIIFLGAVAYFTSTFKPYQNITNITEINIPYLFLDTTNRSITILDVKDKVYSSLFLKKEFIYPLRFSSDEILKIEKILVDFKSENGISEIYFVKNKKEIKILNEIDKTLLNGDILVRVEEVNFIIYYLALLFFILPILFYIFYKKYPEKKFEIEIIATSSIFVVLSLMIFFGSKKIEDNFSLKITVIYSTKLLKSFDFRVYPGKYNVSLSFMVKRGIHTANLKIYLKNDKENVLYFGKPFGLFRNSYEIELSGKNYLVFEIDDEGLYELENIKLIVGPARS